MSVNRFGMSIALCIGLGLLSAPALAQQPAWQVLFGAPRGLSLAGLELTPDGSVYAALSSGGAHNLGTLVRRAADGHVSLLHDFAGPDGSQPLAAPTLGADGNLYGGAASGGQFGYGTAFCVTPAGELTVLHHFTLEDGGAARVAFTRTRDGRMLGVTHGVYTEYFIPPETYELNVRRVGKIFELKPDGTLEILYEGILAPSGRLIETSSGDLYGAKSNISSEALLSAGAVYRLRPDGAIDFIRSPIGPYDPRGELVESVDGYVFGMDPDAVFRLSTGPDDAETDYRVITPRDFAPGGLAFGSDGKLYGGNSTFYSVSLAGELSWGVDLDYQHRPLTATLRADGDGFIAASGDGLYRMQRTGEAVALYRFGYQNGVGLEPTSVMLTRAGDVYGTTSGGGENNAGTLFHRDSSDQASAIHHFSRSDQPMMSQLRAPLAEAPDGALYGITFEGAARLCRVDVAPELTTLHVFDAATSAELPYNAPQQSLVMGADDALYGTLALPPDANGTVKTLLYRFDLTTKQLTELGVFNRLQPLLAATSGAVYGSSGLQDGSGSYFQLFRLSSDGQRQVLYTFAEDPSGHVPDSDFAEGPDGSIYGVAKGRSASATTIVYRLTTSGKLEIYRELSSTTDTWPTPMQQVAVDVNGDVYIKRPYQQVTVVSPDKTRAALPWASTLGFVTHPKHGAFRIEPLTRDGFTGFSLIPISLR
jgi:uncharacterized repeat protein (TIGR03803 family)